MIHCFFILPSMFDVYAPLLPRSHYLAQLLALIRCSKLQPLH